MSNFDLAINTDTPEILKRLADDEIAVRCAVGMNPNTSTETLEHLVNDENYYVRRYVEINPKTPQYIKQYIKIKKFLGDYEQS